LAETIKVLAQAIPNAVTLTDLYTVLASTATVISSVAVCNQSGTAAKFRLSVAVAGAADTPKQYLYYDVIVQPNDTFVATIGITLAAACVDHRLRAESAEAKGRTVVKGGSRPLGTADKIFLFPAPEEV